MSEWRRKASELLPEMQPLISSRAVDSPMSLWVELGVEFGRRCEQPDPPVALLKRIWRYCEWCLAHPDDDVRTAAALGFCEQLLHSDEQARMLPHLMSRRDYLEIRNLLEYHNSPGEVDEWLERLWPER